MTVCPGFKSFVNLWLGPQPIAHSSRTVSLKSILDNGSESFGVTVTQNSCRTCVLTPIPVWPQTLNLRRGDLLLVSSPGIVGVDQHIGINEDVRGHAAIPGSAC
jgi:hypothetical protein